jgi:nicotinamide mononucleotide transporter
MLDFSNPLTYIELLAALLGAVSVWLVTRRNILAFPIGIVMVVLYGFLFWATKLYSDMLLQGIFVVMQIQGWRAWQSGSRADDMRIAVRTFTPLQWIATGVFQVLGTLLLGWLMHTYTDAASPYMDAFCAIQSIAAQWWMNQRYLENWILWIAVDEVYLFLYSSKSLWFTTVLYAFFLVLAVMGYWEWRKKTAVPNMG